MTVHFLNFITVITQTIQLNKFSYKISQGKRKKHTSKTLISTTYYWTYSIWSWNIYIWKNHLCSAIKWTWNKLTSKSFAKIFSFWFIFNRTNRNGINNQKIVFYKHFYASKANYYLSWFCLLVSERFFRKIKYVHL